MSSTTRRSLLKGAAAFGVFAFSPQTSATTFPRIAAVDWAMLETTLALGVAPVAAAELVLFGKAAVEPAVPDGVLDLGLRGALSYEQLRAARPDLILSSPWYEARTATMSRIAPVASFSIYEAGRSPYAAAEQATQALGARIDRAAEADRAIAAAREEIAAVRARLSGPAGRAARVINLGDARHFRAFGADSMFGDVLGRVGLGAAWAEPTRFGAYPAVGVEALAEMRDVVVVNVGPTPPSALAAVRESPLWRAMPPIAAGRFVDLAPVNPYGGLPAARRFARLLVDALTTLGHA